jgi:hypothetical protein
MLTSFLPVRIGVFWQFAEWLAEFAGQGKTPQRFPSLCEAALTPSKFASSTMRRPEDTR